LELHITAGGSLPYDYFCEAAVMPEASNLLTCPHCGTEFCDPSRLAGSVVVCAGCGGNFIFPSGFARRSAARRGRPDRSAEFFCMAATVCVWLMYGPPQ
jgi:predicted RNA-binding Zn-ribbon protein involved in translation (DUF1610 family)